MGLNRREGMRSRVSRWRTVPPPDILIFICSSHGEGYTGHLLSLLQTAPTACPSYAPVARRLDIPLPRAFFLIA